MVTISAPRVLLARGLVEPGWVRLAGARVVEVGAGRPAGEVDVCLPEGTLAPGLVDLHLGGGFGVELATADEAGWRHLGFGLPGTGVTAYLPALMTAPVEQLLAAVARYPTMRAGLEQAGGAQPLGLHLEGPFLSAAEPGLHGPDLLRDPTPELVDALIGAGSGSVVLVTLAPELPGALAAIDRLRAAGVRVSLGHSRASDRQTLAAVERGARFVTHLFADQSSLHQRDPGLVGAALADPRVTVGLVVDRVEVADTAVRVAFAAAAGRVVLVSDALAPLGTPRPWGTGTRSGADLRLDEAVANAIAAGIEPRLALQAASTIPARAIGRPELGRIVPGARADLVWLDATWRARTTWIAGQPVFDADGLLAPAGAP